MTPEQIRLRDAFLAECWAPVREVSIGERAAQRQADRAMQREMEERAVNSASTVVPVISPAVEETSTGCAETGLLDLPGKAPKCA